MTGNIDVQLGSIVISKAGRDKTRPFIVIAIEDEFNVRIADGDLRKVAKPKLKKLKHLNVTKKVAQDVVNEIGRGNKLTDLMLRAAINDFIFASK